MVRCEYCQKDLGIDEGFRIVGTQGKWRSVKLCFCDEQCMMGWDGTGISFGIPDYLGNQGFDLSLDLNKLEPRSKLR